LDVTDKDLEGVDSVPRLKNWNEFQDILKDGKIQKSDFLLQARQARLNKEWAPCIISSRFHRKPSRNSWLKK
jgi:hypothetical protein